MSIEIPPCVSYYELPPTLFPIQYVLSALVTQNYSRYDKFVLHPLKWIVKYFVRGSVGLDVDTAEKGGWV